MGISGVNHKQTVAVMCWSDATPISSCLTIYIQLNLYTISKKKLDLYVCVYFQKDSEYHYKGMLEIKKTTYGGRTFIAF